MLSLGLAGLTLALLYTEVSRFWQGYKVLKPGELTALVNRENALVVDIRAQNDFTPSRNVLDRGECAAALSPSNVLSNSCSNSRTPSATAACCSR